LIIAKSGVNAFGILQIIRWVLFVYCHWIIPFFAWRMATF